MQDHVDIETLACIRAMMSCYDAALAATFVCPGGERQTLIVSCTEICRISAHFLGLGVPRPDLCGQCAELCESCAADCAAVSQLADLAEACRRCAAACRRLAA